MNKLLSILPLSLALCGCSAFAPVVLENSTIAQSQNVSFAMQPKRAQASMPYIGSYVLTCEHRGEGDWYTLQAPNGESAVVHPESWDTTYTASSVNRFASLSVNQSHNSDWTYFEALIVLTFKANTDFNNERLFNSYQFMQEDQSEYVSLGTGITIDEFTSDDSPEISLFAEWTGNSTSTSTFTFPVVYGVTWEGFGVQEYDSVSWLKQYERFDKIFNAIYTDNTEPKLYAFWLESYYLSRQVRYNGDIINLNYVTGMDRLDGFFGKQCKVSFSAVEDVNLQVSATPYDPSWELLNDYNRGYNAGYQNGKADGEKPVSWMRNIFNGMASFFSVEIIPNLSLGLIMFAPLLVLAIIVIVRIFKHGG